MELENLDEHISTKELSVNGISLDYLNFTSKWATFLAIMGFVYIGLLVISGIYQLVNYAEDSIRVALGGMLYLGLAFAYVFPSIYLLRFSGKIKEAHQNPSKRTLEFAFENLKSFFKFLGIFVIVLTVGYAAIFAYAFYEMSTIASAY